MKENGIGIVILAFYYPKDLSYAALDSLRKEIRSYLPDNFKPIWVPSNEWKLETVWPNYVIAETNVIEEIVKVNIDEIKDLMQKAGYK